MRILLADDSGLSRRIAEVALADAGHDVTSVADGADAIAAFARAPSPLVILDWIMPNVDGIEACRRIRALPGGADAFVLMITGREESSDLLAALDAGVDDYLTKPVTPTGLTARIVIAERRLEQDRLRKRAESALAAAERLSGIGETTLALQHEINNPLAALLVHAQMLVADARTPAEKADLDVVVDLTRRIADVVQRLNALKDPRSYDTSAPRR